MAAYFVMMRAVFIIAILFTCWACTNTSGKIVTATNDTSLHSSNSSKVLIELFTSQGCSSCPAADKLIGNIITKDSNVIALSFHVDYWDRSGWKDVFSNHDYTLRQQQYMKALQSESLYTPQAVVQGTYEMVGSNRTRILDAINKVKAQFSNQTIIATTIVDGSKVKLSYKLSAIVPKQQIVIALLQNKATTSVAKGENAGVQLANYNVVRNLIVQPALESGSSEIYLPDDLRRDNASIVLFTQDEQSKGIATITQLHL
jgi:hypothetical protein